MKFLCPECKAKYQIPDEKIAGRTLRMKCRRCEHDIVVKGDPDALDSAQPQHEEAARPGSGKPAAASGRKPSEPALRATKPGARGSGSGAGPLPKGSVPAKGSALGADFRKNVAHGAPEAPRQSIASPLDAWHVSINDVPVGPMRREELGRKIQTGAITGDSLCWREGYDDWRPLKDTELASLLQRRLPPARPAPGPPPPRGAPAARGTTPSRPGIAPAPRSPAPRPGLGAAPARTPAAARSNVVPIGGRLGAAAAPAMDEPDSFDENEATSVAQSPFEEQEAARTSAPDAAALGALAASSTPAPATRIPSVPPGAMTPVGQRAPSVFPTAPLPMDAPVVRRDRGLPVGAWMGIVFAGAAGAVAAVFGGLYFMGRLQAPAQQVATNEVTPSAVVAPPTAPEHVEVAPPDPTTGPATPDSVAPPTNDTPGHHGTGPTKIRPAAATGTGTTNPGTKLSAADRAALAALAADGVGASPTQIPGQRPHVDDSADSTGPEMSADQLRTVVNNGRPQLQHCYELVARQTGSTDAMRVQVHITVGGSGVITRVAATGNADALNTCIEREVRRWHFPGGGEADFPLVFQPGGG